MYCTELVDIPFPELGFTLEAWVIPGNGFNLLSVDLLCAQTGCSFVQLGHLGLPPYLITPDGLHAVALQIEGNIPVYRQNPDEFMVEDIVLQNGIPVPRSLAPMLVLAAKPPVCPAEVAGSASGTSDQGNTADGNNISTAADSVPGLASETRPEDAAGDVAPDIGGDNAGANDVPGGGQMRFPWDHRAHLPREVRWI